MCVILEVLMERCVKADTMGSYEHDTIFLISCDASELPLHSLTFEGIMAVSEGECCNIVMLCVATGCRTKFAKCLTPLVAPRTIH